MIIIIATTIIISNIYSSDITVVNKSNKAATAMEVAASSDRNIAQKRRRNIEQCQGHVVNAKSVNRERWGQIRRNGCSGQYRNWKLMHKRPGHQKTTDSYKQHFPEMST